jgi:hypothetical protein
LHWSVATNTIFHFSIVLCVSRFVWYNEFFSVDFGVSAH